ncbi:MAG: DUF3131 domain-containing protein [Clostridia bacterium]|nr:DUF3131 domain-containing protein [Clostridia bacterium]
MERMDMTIRQAKAALRRYTKQAAKTARTTDAAAWVTDNLPALEAALTDARRALTRQNRTRFTKLYAAWGGLCPGGMLPEEAALSDRLSALRPDLSDCALLPTAAGAYFAAAAAEHAEKELTGDEEAGKTVCACVRSLLALRNVAFDELTEQVCEAEGLLSRDPSGEYPDMSDETKALYRRAVIRGAKKSGVGEAAFARAALERAREAKPGDEHIGFFLPLYPDTKKRAVAFLAGEILLCAAVSLGAAHLAGSRWYFPALYLPVCAALFPLCDMLRGKLFPARPLCAMDEEREIGEENATLIAVAGLLPPAGDGERLYRRLYDLRAANGRGSVKILLLLDKKNAPTPELPEDAADLAALRRVIGRLNDACGGGFCAAVRERVWSPTEEEYTGFERKRGAVIALMKYLRDGDGSRFELLCGDTAGLTDTRYVMALDADTELSFGALRKLAAAARHPLNRAVCDTAAMAVTRGFGCLVPRSEVSLDSAARTFFTRLFTDGGSLSYAPAVSERNMDLFGESVFTGKGLIDVDAFLCAVGDRFARGRILSHDILEGAVLRTGYAGNCEITESFPARPDSYFARMHRWVRGDAQNLRYAFLPFTDTPPGSRLPLLTRYLLTQNVRRAVTPVFALVCLLLAVFTGGKAAAVLFAAALLSEGAEGLLAGLRALARGGPRSVFGRYFSSEIALAAKCFMRSAVCVGLLPRKAAVCADALARAAARTLVTHKNLLRWTTAQQADGQTARPWIGGLAFPLGVALLCGLFAGGFGRLIAVLICLSALLSLADGLPLKTGKKRRVSPRDRETVRSFAAAAWRYFDGSVTAGEHFLPPDNVQETPVMKTARRTSPTNIGLYLVSVAAARDLGLIETEEMLRRLSDTLKTVTALLKYNGCLYNWYDTRTLTPLSPACVSTVDCGNFLCCLTALKEALKELPGDRARALAEQIERLRDETDLTFLYDNKRALFRVGFDADRGELSEACYDLLMSEARMTSYYETARRLVPEKHARALDRTLARCGGYTAAASWTGTMFEYFMPALFLPVEENSFTYESLKACLAAQKRRMGKLPWGISESCFYAADHTGSYRYKAHGLRKLALKRLADDEPVVSPYSSFLALPFDFRGAMKNLSDIAALHAQGACGFYEAVDFTPSRTGGEDYCVVRCYMAHHVGMSMISAANALLDDIFVRRFMRDPEMRSAQSLLRERVPAAPRLYRRRRETAERERSRAPGESPRAEGEPFAEAAVYGGEWLLAADKYGRNRSVFGSLEPYRYSDRCRGVTVSVRADGRTAVLNAAGDTRGKLTETAFTAKANVGKARCRMALLVHPDQPALLVPVRATNDGEESVAVDVSFYFEPLLLEPLKEEPHPAFSDLFLRASHSASAKTLTFRRISGGALCAGFCDRSDFRFTTNRETALARDPYRDAPVYFAGDKTEDGTVCPAAVLTVLLTLPPGKSAETVLAITCAADARAAAERMERVRAGKLPELANGAANPFARDGFAAPLAADLLRDVFFRHTVSAAKRDAVQSLAAGRSALWAAGLSGDRPILTVTDARACSETALRSVLRLHKRLAAAGLPNDLALLTDEAGGYLTGEATAFDALLREEDLLADKGREGGVFVLRKPALSQDTLTALTAFSSLLCPEEAPAGEPLPPPQKEKATPAAPPEGPDAANGDIPRCFSPGGFTVSETPPLPWSHTLSNRSFGTLTTDGSLGFTWAYNAQLNRLTPWSNDTSADLYGERLYLETGVSRYDAVWGAKARFTDTQAIYESVCGPFRVTVTVAVPERGAKKRITAELVNLTDAPQEAVFTYRLLPQLAERRADSAFVKCKVTQEGVCFRNPLNCDFPGAALLYCDAPEAYGVGKAHTGGAEWTKVTAAARLTVTPGESAMAVFGLCFAATEEAAVRLKHAPFAEKKPFSLSVSSGCEAADRFAGALLAHQVRDARLLARCGFYQCAGGYGFRDQLQDMLPLTKRDPALCREVLFKMAAVQFPEGDVLHWFHPVFRDGALLYKGVRTRCSDDRLWLPYAAAKYVSDTGDRDILRKKAPFLTGEPLGKDEKSRYADRRHGGETTSFYNHCLRCFGAARFGRHGLPLIGGGDWNDAFDALGEKGKGESVWLAMFLRRTALDFAGICGSVGDADNRGRLLRLAEHMAEACEKYAWAGDRYLRAFADDGSPVGAPGAAACAVDLLPQAWASLADLPDEQKRKAALTTAFNQLYDEEHGLVKLFTPPFTEKDPRAGYINDYPAGVRENGGQYTHAAVWFLTALRKEGMQEEADKVLRALLPNEKYRSPDGKSVYRTEPYALCGDVYAAPGMEGRGGWSLYTGAAGWLLQYLAPLES